MSKTIALLSGKGGSGKTTLALSMASMLSKCDLKILLIDCDLSTNGATYFYENMLSDYNEDVVSFYDVLFERKNYSEKVIKISTYMSFMPSIMQITKKNTESYLYSEQDEQFICKSIRELKNNYDVIIFDCQAGYTDLFKVLLPNIDINLVVMEADAISSAAIRSLYLKVGEYLNEKTVYQIFNKATTEEYEIYSKLSGGTVFTNIETVMFDWKIRKAFSVAEIPDMEKTSANYGIQIYKICRILFKEEYIQERLNKFGEIIEINENREKEKKLESKINELRQGYNNKRSKMTKFANLGAIVITVPIFLSTFYQLLDKKYLVYVDENTLILGIAIIILCFCMILILIVVMDKSKERRNIYKQIDLYQKQIEEIIAERQEIQTKYKVLDDTMENK